MLTKLVSLFSAILIFSACYLSTPVNSEIKAIVTTDPMETLKIWALADIQPRNKKEKDEFSDAIKDIDENVPDIDFAIVAGDIIEEAKESDFDWYMAQKPDSYIKEWYEIAGNHDLKIERGEAYKKKIRKDFYYTVTKGNILFIFMSNEARGKPTVISDETFEWWKNLVINNQDKIIVVITHAPLNGSGIPFSNIRDRQIIKSRRFNNVLRKYRVDLWMSGHLHLPQSLTNNIVVKKDFNGAIFMHISSIRSELWGMKNSESRILTFTCSSDTLRIQGRDHTEEKYEKDLEVTLQLSKKYVCGR